MLLGEGCLANNACLGREHKFFWAKALLRIQMSRPPPRPNPPAEAYASTGESKGLGKKRKDEGRLEKPLARQPPKRPAGMKPSYAPEGVAKSQIGHMGKPPPNHDLSSLVCLLLETKHAIHLKPIQI